MGKALIAKLEANRRAAASSKPAAKKAKAKPAAKRGRPANSEDTARNANAVVQPVPQSQFPPLDGAVSMKEDLKLQMRELQKLYEEIEKNEGDGGKADQGQVPIHSVTGAVVVEKEKESQQEMKEVRLNEIFASRRPDPPSQAPAATQSLKVEGGSLTIQTAPVVASPSFKRLVGTVSDPRFSEQLEALIRKGQSVVLEQGGGYLLRSAFFRKEVFRHLQARVDLMDALLKGWENQVEATQKRLFAVVVDLQIMLTTEEFIVAETDGVDLTVRERRFANAEMEARRFPRMLYDSSLVDGTDRQTMYAEMGVVQKLTVAQEKHRQLPSELPQAIVQPPVQPPTGLYQQRGRGHIQGRESHERQTFRGREETVPCKTRRGSVMRARRGEAEVDTPKVAVEVEVDSAICRSQEGTENHEDVGWIHGTIARLYIAPVTFRSFGKVHSLEAYKYNCRKCFTPKVGDKSLRGGSGGHRGLKGLIEKAALHGLTTAIFTVYRIMMRSNVRSAGDTKSRQRKKRDALREKFGVKFHGAAKWVAPLNCVHLPLSPSEAGGWVANDGFMEAYKEVRAKLPTNIKRSTLTSVEVDLIDWSGSKSVGSPQVCSEKVRGLRVSGATPMYDALASRVHCWEKLQVDPDVVSMVRSGFRPVQDSRLAPIYQQNRVDPGKNGMVDDWIASQCSAGLMRPFKAAELGMPQAVVPIMVVQSSGKDRVVLDYSSVNTTMESRPFALPSVSDLFGLEEMWEGLWKADLKLGFNHLIHAVSARGIAAIVWRGVAYELVACQLGMCQVPRAFQRLTSAVASVLSAASGRPCFVYLDDFFGWAKASSSWISLARKLDLPEDASPPSILVELGFALGRDKVYWPPRDEGNILGYWVNPGLQEIAVAPEKASNIVLELEEIGKSPTVLVRDLARTAGRIAACRLAWGSAQLVANLLLSPVAAHIQLVWSELELEADLVHLWDDEVSTPMECVKECRKWIEFCVNAPNQPFFPSSAVVIESDASSTGLGAVIFEDGRITTLRQKSSGDHINVEELRAAVKALEKIRKGEQLQRVSLRVDNTAAVAWLAKGSTRKNLMPLLVHLLRVLREKKLMLNEVHWISTEVNVIADTLSRDGDFGFGKDSFDAWLLGLRMEGRPLPTLDAFASPSDKLLDRFCSWKLCDSATYTDFFHSNMKNEILWCNPPFALLPRVILKIKGDKLSAYVVLPVGWDRSLSNFIALSAKKDRPEKMKAIFVGIIFFWNGSLL
eukprot:gene23348-18_t